MISSFKRACITLALVPFLSGCIGALAIPLVAGGTLMARHKVRVRAATPQAAATAAPVPQVTVVPLSELPPPSGAPSPTAGLDTRWREFADYAIGVAHKDPTVPRSSALLISGGQLIQPDRQPCTTKFAAVTIDLDPGRAAFSPEQVSLAPPAVTESLAKLRAEEIVILWITQLPASRAGDVAAALKRSGLDPDGTDQLLLVRTPEDRKQALLKDAQTDVCIVAMLGDRRGDFDELFDYLRDPNAAIGLSAMVGQGWFLAPPPTGPVTDSLPSWDAPAAE